MESRAGRKMQSTLAEPVLVLNRSWIPVNVATVRRALVLLYCDVARAVWPEDYSTYDFQQWVAAGQRFNGQNGDGHIRSGRIQVLPPEVIVLTGFNGCYVKEARCTRRNIYERDGGVCQYCGRKRELSRLTLDHVVPRSRGGVSTWENVVLACLDCNSRKGDRLPQESGMKLVRTPAKPAWAGRLGSKLAGQRKPSWMRFLGERVASSGAGR